MYETDALYQGPVTKIHYSRKTTTTTGKKQLFYGK